MSHPVEGDNGDAKAAPPPEAERTTPEQAAEDAIGEAAALAEVAPRRESDVADVAIPDADIPALDIPEPTIPDPVLSASVLEEPVIPPMPDAADEAGTASDDPDSSATPATRAERRALPNLDSLPEPAPIPRDPSVVPPPAGATTNGYRGWTIAIFSILVLLLIAAVVTIAVLLASGTSPIPAAAAAAAPVAVPGSGWISLVR